MRVEGLEARVLRAQGEQGDGGLAFMLAVTAAVPFLLLLFGVGVPLCRGKRNKCGHGPGEAWVGGWTVPRQVEKGALRLAALAGCTRRRGRVGGGEGGGGRNGAAHVPVWGVWMGNVRVAKFGGPRQLLAVPSPSGQAKATLHVHVCSEQVHVGTMVSLHTSSPLPKKQQKKRLETKKAGPSFGLPCQL